MAAQARDARRAARCSIRSAAPVSTLVAADWLGIEAVGIEQDAQTCADAEAKIKRLRARRMLGDAKPMEAPLRGQMDLLEV